MLDFLSPGWLWSLLALGLPLAVHLLSRGQRHRIRIGSVKLLQETPSRSFRRIHLHEILLLLLRTALLASLALLLAEPRLHSNPTDTKTLGWILASPAFLEAQEKPARFQELLDAGHSLRLLAPGFPQPGQSRPQPDAVPENIWSLLEEADRLEHPIAAVFTEDRLALVRGRRPALAREPEWHTLAAEGEKRWIALARTTEAARARVRVGASDASRTSFTEAFVSLPETGKAAGPAGFPALEVRTEAGQPRISVPSQDTAPSEGFTPVQPALPEQSVSIQSSPSSEAEAKVVRAALEAAAARTGLRLDFQQQPQSAGLVFWLSEQPLPPDLEARVSNGVVLFQVVTTGPIDRRPSRILAEGWTHLGAPSLFQRTEPTGRGMAVWRDGFGRPLLEVESSGQGRHFRFYSRFDPAWSQLASHPVWPEWMLDLLDGPVPSDRGFDRRALAPQQRLPATRDSSFDRPPPRPRDLAFPFWLAVALIFALERWLSARRSS